MLFGFSDENKFIADPVDAPIYRVGVGATIIVIAISVHSPAIRIE